jgi:hypothetical protein
LISFYANIQKNHQIAADFSTKLGVMLQFDDFFGHLQKTPQITVSTAKRTLERLGIQTSSSFFKI